MSYRKFLKEFDDLAERHGFTVKERSVSSKEQARNSPSGTLTMYSLEVVETVDLTVERGVTQ